MCVLSVATLNSGKDWVDQYPNQIKFISLLNRDEQLLRTTLLPTNDTPIISAIDVLHHGTSNGLNQSTGLYVALTNYYSNDNTTHIHHDPTIQYTSRGILVNTLLDMSIDEFRRMTLHHQLQFNCNITGFNIFMCNLFDHTPIVLFITNRPNSAHVQSTSNTIYKLHLPTDTPSNNDDVSDTSNSPHHIAYIQQLSSVDDIHQLYTIHGISNGYLNDQRYPRIHKLQHKLSDILQESIGQCSNTTIDTLINHIVHHSSAALNDMSYDKQQLSNVCDNPDCLSSQSGDIVLLNNAREVDALKLSTQLIYIPSNTVLHHHHHHPNNSPPVDMNTVWATRSQTIIIATTSTIYYYYRTTVNYPLPDPWITYQIPIPP